MFLLTELLKKLASDECAVYISISSNGSVECDILREEGKLLADGWVETVDELPLAVCRACLKLMERIEDAD